MCSSTSRAHTSMKHWPNLVSVPDSSSSTAHFVLGTCLVAYLTKYSFYFFYSERFVAKVTNVFERSADLLLLWSPKRDIRDLKIKAYLRLVESKRYNGHGHNGSSRYSRQSREILPNENLDVSDIIFVEFVQLKEKNRELLVARCKSLSASSDAHVDDQNVDDALLSEDKYRAESPSRLSFQEYMIHHRDLQNPALIKRPGFTSILHHKQVIESYRRKFEKDYNEEKPNPSTTKSAQNDDDDVIILEERIAEKSIQACSKIQYQNDPLGQASRSPTLPSNYKRSSISINSDNQPISITSHHIAHSQKTKSHISVRSRSTSSSSSSSSSSDTSSSSSSNSSESSRKRHKRSHKKYKSKNRHEKHHTRRSKKRSKKSKKKKSYRERGNSPGKKSRSPKRKKIDHKILELLNMTK